MYNNNDVEKSIYDNIHQQIKPLETLFVYGTKAENLKEVIDTLKEEKQEELIGDLFEINPDFKDKLLLIPVYKESDRMLVDENYIIKFEISNNDYELTKNYYNFIGDKIALVKYDSQPKILSYIKTSFTEENNYYKIESNASVIEKPEILIKNIINHF